MVSDDVRQQMARMAAAASWGMGESIILRLSLLIECTLCIAQWDSMEEYACMIPRDSYDGAFYRSVLALHMDQYQLAQQVGLLLLSVSSFINFCVSTQCIDKARDILDTELTAMAGESYSRAYGVCRFDIPSLSLSMPIISYEEVN